MPELPEVQSSVLYLKREVLGRTFLKIWTDSSKMGKSRGSLNGNFENLIKGKEIRNIRRRAKNIIIELSDSLDLLIHYKMTGHLLVGKWKRENGEWVSEVEGPLREDKMNKYIRFIFFLDDGRQLAFSDLRKFGKIEVWKRKQLREELRELGPEPLDDDFTFERFEKDVIDERRKMIKPLIMEQSSLAGVGNIYASEALWMAGIHPETKANKLSEKKQFELYKSIRQVLKEGLESEGDSLEDFRLPDGTKGGYQHKQKVYSREGEDCPKCGGEIKKIRVGNRGTYLCPDCQPKR